MADNSIISKIIERTPLALIVTGSALFIIGAAGGWPQPKLQVNELGWRIALATMGVVIAGLGGLLLWRERNSNDEASTPTYGITIDNPRQGDEVGEWLEVHGSYSKAPTDGAMRLFVVTGDGRNIWPQSMIRIVDPRNKRWSCLVNLAGNPNQTHFIKVAIVGQSARVLCDYYHQVGEKTRWEPIHEWPEDATECYSVVVKKSGTN